MTTNTHSYNLVELSDVDVLGAELGFVESIVSIDKLVGAPSEGAFKFDAVVAKSSQ